MGRDLDAGERLDGVLEKNSIRLGSVVLGRSRFFILVAAPGLRTGTPKSWGQILSLLCLPFHHAAHGHFLNLCRVCVASGAPSPEQPLGRSVEFGMIVAAREQVSIDVHGHLDRLMPEQRLYLLRG